MNLVEFKSQLTAVKFGDLKFNYRQSIREDLNKVVRASPMNFHIIMTIEEIAEVTNVVSCLFLESHFDMAAVLEELADSTICIEVLVHALQGNTEVVYSNATLRSNIEHFQRNVDTGVLVSEDDYTKTTIFTALRSLSLFTQHLTKMLRGQWDSELKDYSLAEVALTSILTIRNGLQIANADWQAALAVKWNRVVQRASSKSKPEAHTHLF